MHDVAEKYANNLGQPTDVHLIIRVFGKFRCFLQMNDTAHPRQQDEEVYGAVSQTQHDP